MDTENKKETKTNETMRNTWATGRKKMHRQKRNYFRIWAWPKKDNSTHTIDKPKAAEQRAATHQKI